jgi:hypothetical protein
VRELKEGGKEQQGREEGGQRNEEDSERGTLGLFIRPGGGGAGWVDRTFPFRRGVAPRRPRNGVRTGREGESQPVRWRQRGRRAAGSGYLPCPGAHAMKSGACTAPVFFFHFPPLPFCFAARAPHGGGPGEVAVSWWGWVGRCR